MRGAIVGFGAIAQGHLAGYREVDELTVVAVVDPTPARRELARSQHGLAAYPSFEALMEQERLDFLDICAPPSTHVPYSLLGLRHGLHVLCEKPVFLPGDEGHPELLAAIEASDRTFYPCHVYHFAPILHVMRGIVAAPEFGPVLGADFRTLRRGHARGVPQWHPHWRRDRAVSAGGILQDHGPHSVYLAMTLTGGTPAAVSCLTGNLRPDEHRDTEDTALVRVRCTDGVEVALTLTWGSGYRGTTYSILGGAGSVVVDGDDLRHAVDGTVVRRSVASDFDDPSHQEWFGRLLRHFCQTVSDPGLQRDLLREALVTAMVIESGYRSAADEGRWVDVPALDGASPLAYSGHSG